MNNEHISQIGDPISERAYSRLKQFQLTNGITSKGQLSLVVQFTRMVRDRDFPLNPADFQTDSKGQVTGIGGGNLKKILAEHGITKQLTSEGGRTSRGSMGLMMTYVQFLNQWSEDEAVDLFEVENFWAEEVREYFRNQPFVLSSDTSKTVTANLADLFDQAKKREKQNKGTRYLGVILQHLVAAKLQVVLSDDGVEIHGASVADKQTDRAGDFVINSTAFHCTTAPADLLMEKCKANLKAGYRPVIITIYDRVHTALTQIEDGGMQGQVDVWDIQQFLSSNVMEHSGFNEVARNHTLAEIIDKYNAIIDAVEHDPSLHIVFEAK